MTSKSKLTSDSTPNTRSADHVLESLDDIVGSEQLFATAFHEAGHASIGFFLGVAIGTVKLERDSTAIEWDGNAEAYPQKRDDIGKVALAGPLAEIKLRGHLQLGNNLDTGATIASESVSAIVEALHKIANDPSARPEITCEMILENDCQPFVIRLHACDDDVQKTLNTESDLNDLVIQALTLVNDPAIWNKIVRLANALVRANERTILRRSLSASHVTNILSTRS